MKTFIPIFFVLFTLCNCGSGSSDQTDQNATAPEYPEKTFTDLEVDQFKAKMTADDVVLLDVRTPEETAEGMIEGAVEINFRGEDFADKIAALDKDKTYLVYCRSGGRSVEACEHMAAQDFKKLYNLLGGYTAWKEAGE